MSTIPDLRAINAALQTASQLITFHLDYTPTGYDLRLTLGRKGIPAVTLLCTDVQNLELNPTGDGFDQMFKLQVTDMREDKLERIAYSVEELERETLFLHCAGVTLEPVVGVSSSRSRA